MSSAAERKKQADAIAKRVSGSKKQDSGSCAVIGLAVLAGLPTLFELGKAFA